MAAENLTGCCSITTCAGSFLALLIIYKIYLYIRRRPIIGDLSERYILVTGCGRGFGLEITKRLDQMGCHVFAACQFTSDLDLLRSVTSERCHGFLMDVTKPETVRSAFEMVKAKLPPGKGLWGVVNNAGIGGRKTGPGEWLSISDYKEVIEVNLLGTVDVTITFLPLVKKSRGRVVNMSSISGRTGIPVAFPYTCSKYGVEGFSDSLRRTLRVFKCSVHLIEPGMFCTDLTSDANLKAVIQRGWDATTQDVRDEFGEEYLPQIMAYSIKGYHTEFFNRIPHVVNAVVHALLGKNPQARYLVGNDAKFIHWPITLMPEPMGDWILEKLSPMPVPAVLKKAATGFGNIHH